jgi:hypothetical protein
LGAGLGWGRPLLSTPKVYGFASRARLWSGCVTVPLLDEKGTRCILDVRIMPRLPPQL